MDFSCMTIDQLAAALANGSVTSVALVDNLTERFEADKKSAVPLNAVLEVYADSRSVAQKADDERAAAAAQGKDALADLLRRKPLLGVPFIVKDNISVKGKALTCSSHILEGYVAPYNATVSERLIAAGAVPVGRANMDEFAMGSSTEYSIYGPTRNPVDRAYVSGGSSGGPAASVAARLVPFALGTDTGGSVRLPASYCGIYGYKPTYGVLSRWGVVAYGSSLDQVGVLASCPRDIATPLSVLCGVDRCDDTSADLPARGELASLQPLSDADFAKLKVAVPRQFIENKGLSADVAAVFENTRAWFVAKGAQVDVVDLPVLEAAVASYYVIALSEAASNLSRFDGIRYGARKDIGQGYDALYVATRSGSKGNSGTGGATAGGGFGPEVKRRIVIGNYVLSERLSGNCYKSGMTVRARIQRDIATLFESYDVMLCPTCPTPSFKIGQKVDDPLEMYLSDLYTTFVNLARIPSVSVPAGRTQSADVRLPVGIQFAGKMFSDVTILRIAQNWEQEHAGCGFPLSAGEDK